MFNILFTQNEQNTGQYIHKRLYLHFLSCNPCHASILFLSLHNQFQSFCQNHISVRVLKDWRMFVVLLTWYFTLFTDVFYDSFYRLGKSILGNSFRLHQSLPKPVIVAVCVKYISVYKMFSSEMLRNSHCVNF